MMATKPLLFRRDINDKSLPLKQPEFEINPHDSLRDQIVTAIRGIYDPEISVNIYDLGLIYSIDIDEKSQVDVKMTLTAPACPVAGSLPGQVEAVIRSLDGVADAHVELVWDPPWSKDMMSDEARLALGLF
jgi:FeS assembly SUF system protein